MSETIPIGLIRPPPDANPPPKNQFRESGNNISAHRALLERGEFQRAVHFAKLQFMRELAAKTTDNNLALAAGFKVAGVEEFTRILLTLSETEPLIRQQTNDNLEHRH